MFSFTAGCEISVNLIVLLIIGSVCIFKVGDMLIIVVFNSIRYTLAKWRSQANLLFIITFHDLYIISKSGCIFFQWFEGKEASSECLPF